MERVCVVNPTTFSRMTALERTIAGGARLLHVCEYVAPGVWIYFDREKIDPMALGQCCVCHEQVDNAPLGRPEIPGVLTPTKED